MLHEFWLRIKGLLLRRRFDRDLDDELAFHLMMREQKNRAATAPGEGEAREAALRQFGNAARTREEMRRMRSFSLLESFFHDLAYGIRLLLKSPLFTLIAVMTLALGMLDPGSNGRQILQRDTKTPLIFLMAALEKRLENAKGVYRSQFS